MRIALIAPPFIAVPPKGYGGTELYIAQLGEGLVARGHGVTVFANGESTVRSALRWTFPHADWPPQPGGGATLKNLDHSAWAMNVAQHEDFDLVHVNDAISVPMSRFLSKPVVHTLHHPHDPDLSALYARHPWVQYVTISAAQRAQESMRQLQTIHHGIRLEDYRFTARKQPYLAFLGRMAPVKAPHLAIEVARRAGLPLKLAGEIQPMFRDYWRTQVEPHVDGRTVDFVGEASLDVKNDLLANASALLFPIQWDEPFGLVMIEAMACGTPVIALAGGAVAEVVSEGVSGWICGGLDEMAARARNLDIPPDACRRYVAQRFSLERMVADYESLYASCIARGEAGAQSHSSSRKAD